MMAFTLHVTVNRFLSGTVSSLRGICVTLMSSICKNLDFMYMFISRFQPLQIAGNKLLVFFFFQENYYFASNRTPICEKYPSHKTLMAQYFNIN